MGHALLFVLLSSLDLESVKSEANLEKRAELALENANDAIDKAKQFAADAQYDKLHLAVIEVRDSVELCQDSLVATGKDPRKNTRQFKKVEMKIHLLTRRLRSFAFEVSVEDRPTVEKVAERLDEINDEIVTGIFTKRKKQP